MQSLNMLQKILLTAGIQKLHLPEQPSCCLSDLLADNYNSRGLSNMLHVKELCHCLANQ